MYWSPRVPTAKFRPACSLGHSVESLNLLETESQGGRAFLKLSNCVQAIRVGEKFTDMQTVEAAKHVLSGLSEIHRHSFIHTDINAHNIMRVRASGGYNHVILDVGLASKMGILHIEAAMGADGQIKTDKDGRPIYIPAEDQDEQMSKDKLSKIVPFVKDLMAPEDLLKLVRHADFVAPELWRWRGDEDQERYKDSPDYRSDIWSVGVLMFYLLVSWGCNQAE